MVQVKNALGSRPHRTCAEVCGCGLMCLSNVPSAMLQVRDAALVAAGKCVAAFPEECRATLPELLKLWSAHLDDNIPSVRANAAAALGDALKAYKQELLDQLLPLIR